MGKARRGSRTRAASIRAIADMPLPPAGIWLLATVPDQAGGELSVTQEFGTAPRGFGGDVVIHLTAGAETSPDGLVNVQVLAVAGGALVTVGTWESLPRRSWAERIRPSVVFAASALAVIREHADLGGVVPLAPGTRQSGLPDLPRRPGHSSAG